MQFRFFSIPVSGDEEATEALNQFLCGHRIVSVDREFVARGEHSLWAVCVCYLLGQAKMPTGRKNKVDYREVLPEAEFVIYAKLRSLRKQIAESEGVPAYALFTNQQLATMVSQRATTKADMREIDGVGQARIDKYADAFLAVLQQDVPPLTEAAQPVVMNEA